MEEFVREPRNCRWVIHHHGEEYEIYIHQRLNCIMTLMKNQDPVKWYDKEWDLFDEAMSLLHGVKVLGKYE